MKFGTALPQNVVQNNNRLQVKDEKAFSRLNELVRSAAKELSALGKDPVAVAASPYRFDDANTYDWRAVRCGRFFSEKGSYGGRYDLDGDIVAAPPEAKAANEILEKLQNALWRDLFATAFEVECSDQSLAVVIQESLSWLVFSTNNYDDQYGDPVFAIWDDRDMTYFGEAKDRFDWGIQDERPLVFLTNSNEGGILQKP
jgi:hypothetical protein